MSFLAYSLSKSCARPGPSLVISASRRSVTAILAPRSSLIPRTQHIYPKPSPVQHRKMEDTTVRQQKASDNEIAKAVEQAKQRAATKAVADFFRPSMHYVGIGSGTTIQYVVEAIKERMDPKSDHTILFVPTGYQSRSEIEKKGLIAVPFDSLPEGVMLDVAFDGADEVDEEMNCVKGGGACLFQEKMVAMRARKFVCVADHRKDVKRLLTGWTYIPIEVAPIAVKPVLQALRALGSPNPELRILQVAKSGPLKTDQDFYIIKAPFPPLLTQRDVTSENHGSGETMGKTSEGLDGRVWEVGRLATAIKAITGVLEVGLFVGVSGTEMEKLKGQGNPVAAEELPKSVVGAVAGATTGEGMMASQGGQKPVAAYFGMKDGSVSVRTAPTA